MVKNEPLIVANEFVISLERMAILDIDHSEFFTR